MSAVLALDNTYQPHRWIPYDEAITLEAKGLVLDHLGDEIILYNGGTNREGRHSSLVTSSIVVVDGQPSDKRYRAPVLTNSSLFQRDRNTCAYCAGLFATLYLTRDHIMPVSKGGEDKWMNVVTACKGCNNLKGDTLPGKPLPNGGFGPQGTRTMDPIYVPYIPCKAEAMLMKNRTILFDQMNFLLERIANKDQSRVYRALKAKSDDMKATTAPNAKINISELRA